MTPFKKDILKLIGSLFLGSLIGKFLFNATWTSMFVMFGLEAAVILLVASIISTKYKLYKKEN